RLPGLHDLAMRSPDKAKGRIRGQPRIRGTLRPSPGALRLPGQHNLAMRSPDKAEGRIRARPRSRGTLRPFPRVRFAYPGYTTSQCVARIRPKAASGVLPRLRGRPVMHTCDIRRQRAARDNAPPPPARPGTAAARRAPPVRTTTSAAPRAG